MTYELSKQLHESGFPNLGIYRHDFIEEPNNDKWKPGWDIKATCKLCGEERQYASGGSFISEWWTGCPIVSDYRTPTLSELIENTPQMVALISTTIQNGIIPGGKNWAATARPEIIKKGDTPEEVVAQIWLHFNS